MARHITDPDIDNTTLEVATGTVQIKDDGVDVSKLAADIDAATIGMVVGKLKETSGPTTLALAAIADGKVLKRSGATIIGGDSGGCEYTCIEVSDNIKTILEAASDGDAFWLVGGTHTLSDTIALSANNVIIRGDRTAIVKHPTAKRAFTISGDNNILADFQTKALAIDSDDAIVILGNGNRIDNLLITGFASIPTAGIEISGASRFNTIENCEITLFAVGIYVNAGNDTTLVHNNLHDLTSYGIHAISSNNANVSGNRLVDVGDHNIYSTTGLLGFIITSNHITLDAADTFDGIHIEDSTFQGVIGDNKIVVGRGAGIYLADTSRVTVCSNVLTTSATDGDGIQFSSCEYFTVSHNQVLGTGKALSISSGSGYWTVAGNVFDRLTNTNTSKSFCDLSGKKGIFVNNVVRTISSDLTAECLSIGASVDNATISHNTIEPKSGEDSITIAAGGDNNILIGNGYPSGSISDGGTGNSFLYSRIW